MLLDILLLSNIIDMSIRIYLFWIILSEIFSGEILMNGI